MCLLERVQPATGPGRLERVVNHRHHRRCGLRPGSHDDDLSVLLETETTLSIHGSQREVAVVHLSDIIPKARFICIVVSDNKVDSSV